MSCARCSTCTTACAAGTLTASRPRRAWPPSVSDRAPAPPLKTRQPDDHVRVVQEIGVDVGTAPPLVTPALLGVGDDFASAACGHPAIENHADHGVLDRKSTRLNSSHVSISYAVFCLKKNTYIPIMSDE